MPWHVLELAGMAAWNLGLVAALAVLARWPRRTEPLGRARALRAPEVWYPNSTHDDDLEGLI